MRHRNDDMLLHVALGDAYALGVEYVKREEHPDLYEQMFKFERYVQHPVHLKLRPGMYSDDTQQSISVSELLLESAKNPRAFNGDRLVYHFYHAFYRDQRDGYSRGFQELLESATSPDDLRYKIRPDSNKNGAAMRSVPLGVLATPEKVIAAACTNARVTHDTMGGIDSSVAVALMSHFAFHSDLDFSHMNRWCGQHHHSFEYFVRPWEGPVVGNSKDPTDRGVGVNTAWAVNTLLRSQSSMMGIMRQLLEWGGDTDSVGAIAWGIAGCRYQQEELPEFLARDLEATGNLKYGPDYLRALGKKLMDAYSVP